MSVTFRRVTEADEPWISDWIARDPTHVAAGITFKDVMEEGTEAFVISDPSGFPLMVARYHLAFRVAMQFNPEAKFRVAKYAPEVMRGLQEEAKNRGANEIMIRPGGAARSFSERLGFKEFIGKFIGVK